MRLIVNAIPLTYVQTGIGRYIRSLYSEIERRYGDRVEIGYFDGHNVSPTMPRGPKHPGKWSTLVAFFWRLPPWLALVIRLVMHARRERRFYGLAAGYDVYHETAFFPFRVPSEVKTVFTVHDLSLSRHPEWHPKERVLFHRLFYQKRLSQTDRFITVSHFTSQELERLHAIPDRKITVTHLAHDPALFRPAASCDIREVRTRYALPERYFLFVGSGDPRKNAHIISKALAQSGLEIPLVAVGWQGWVKRVEDDEKSCVVFVDYVPDEDLPAIYGGALALIYPSLYEGFGLPVLEAMACGCPVVTTKKASLPEVGGDAVLYLKDPHDPAELAQILVDLSRQDASERERMVSNGLQQASRFSWYKTAVKTMIIYKFICESGNQLT